MNAEGMSLIAAFTDSRYERWADSDWYVPYRAAILDIVMSKKDRLKSNIREILLKYIKNINKYESFEVKYDEIIKIKHDLFGEKFEIFSDDAVNRLAYTCLTPIEEFDDGFEYYIPINFVFIECLGVSEEDFCSSLAFHFDNYERKLLGE